ISDLRRAPAAVRFISFEPLLGPIHTANLSTIDWAIVGGESGPAARPMDEAWVREIRNTCREQHVAFFFKQWGGRHKKAAGLVPAGRTGDEPPAARAVAGIGSAPCHISG